MTTPRGRPPHVAGRQEEAFRSPSSPEEDPLKMNSMEKGYEPDCKIYVSVIILTDKTGYIYQSTLVHLQLGGGLTPCGHGAVRTPSGAGPPDEGFFPRLETLVSKSSEAVLFLPWGEGILDSSPRLSSFAEALIPPVWMNNE